MKKIFTSTILVCLSAFAFSTPVTIVNSGFTFSPSVITINAGDSVLFTLASIHNVAEVSQTTWNANGNTQLVGGFSAPQGGGLILPAKLTVGTHWYVCQPHASMGMKGRIIVQSNSGIAENMESLSIQVFPNPFVNQVTVDFGKIVRGSLQVYNSVGEIVDESAIDSDTYHFDFGNKANGFYFIVFTDEDGTKSGRRMVKI